MKGKLKLGLPKGSLQNATIAGISPPVFLKSRFNIRYNSLKTQETTTKVQGSRVVALCS